jgi:hypothetical protein
MKIISKKDELVKHKEYIEFLKKRLNSEHYKASVPREEYEKTKAKYDKAKLVLRILEGNV